jgi:hypothetical protein
MKQISFGILVSVFLLACSGADSGERTADYIKGQNYSKELDSDSFKTASDRVNVLSKEIKAFSAIKDAEFELFNVNGFSFEENRSVPGASSLDYKFVVRIDTNDIAKWTEGFLKTDSIKYDGSWTEKMVLNRKSIWKKQSKPLIFYRSNENVILFVFKEEGIIFKRVIDL